jgi:hypothetical protein
MASRRFMAKGPVHVRTADRKRFAKVLIVPALLLLFLVEA